MISFFFIVEFKKKKEKTSSELLKLIYYKVLRISGNQQTVEKVKLAAETITATPYNQGSQE